MFRATFLIGAGAAAVTLAGCATMDHADARAEAAATLANAPALAASTNAVDVVGNTAMAWGDRWTATNLYERAANSQASVDRRFNLAAGYESTGRLREAADLYQSVVADGQFVTAITNPGVNGGRAYRVNVADLAAVGLARVRTQLAMAPGIGAVAAGELGTPAAAVVGASAGPVSDAEALRRDAIENPLR